MTTLCEAVEQDWSGAHRLDHLKESVHAALGHLIKQRRVYYTGNKGYFLVAPDSGSPLKGLGNRLSRFRHSLRDKHFGGGGSGAAKPATTTSKLVDRVSSPLLRNLSLATELFMA